MHTRADCCRGEKCNYILDDGSRCGEEAMHKVGEEADTSFSRFHAIPFHNLTAYLCCEHFVRVMGPMAAEYSGCDVDVEDVNHGR